MTRPAPCRTSIPATSRWPGPVAADHRVRACLARRTRSRRLRRTSSPTSTSWRPPRPRPRPPPTAGHRGHHAPRHVDDGEEEVRAVVLVGGEGTRLRPLTLTTPKQMLPVGGRPMIERVLGHLAHHGIDEVVLSLGYRPDAFRDAYPDGRCAGVEAHLRGGGDAARHRRGHPFRRPAGRDRRDLRGRQRRRAHRASTSTGLVAFHRERGAEATIALTPVPGPVRLRGGAHRRPGAGPGVHREAPARAGADQLDQRRDLRARAVGRWLASPTTGGSRSSGRPSRLWSPTGALRPGLDADWVDAGTPATFLAANLRYAADVGDNGGGGTVTGPGARSSPACSGRDVTVGAGAVVEGSVLFSTA